MPEDVNDLYTEARRAAAAGAPTAAVMACRKVLMAVSVEQGADPGQSFVNYVDWLEEKGYIPPGGRAWVDRIRDAGNEATHEIPDIDEETARQVLSFTEALLYFVYESPVKLGPPAEGGEASG